MPAHPRDPARADRRATLTRRFGPFVALAAQLPRWVPFAVALALLAAGILAPGPLGAAALLLIALLLAGLAWVRWPALDPGARTLRVAAVLVVAAVAASRVA